MWERERQSFYRYLLSQETGHNYLHQCYQNINGIDAEAKSYENCNAFLYYIDHGNRFFANAKQLETLLQPLLLFYGTTHLLKACLLTKRPNYPESTAILAHGVSTRKRKKKQYTFMQDEVKTQHNGLFSYVAKHLYLFEHVPFEKIKMRDLLALIPEMNDLFTYSNDEKLVSIGKLNATTLHFPIELLDSYHLTKNTFVKRITSHLPKITNLSVKANYIYVELEKPLNSSTGPFFFHFKKGEIYFPRHRDNFLVIPEVLIHYLLLYNLSMISRYETEWWGELLATKAEIDYPFIKQFLDVTAEKMPLLLGNELFHNI
ncbi:YaaC family protein [Virgibacillus ndiopensis]|uniref:YaaC family protein n=1 Tax=Virgibacillus ndiopensis TaxID=2004408 RepID=UPI000C06C318|nr:YaaC family protein [Virgibacillus ndiopensis]